VTSSAGYTNPVIPGFHPDPSVCRVADEYYLVTSTFTWFPGVPIFRSVNLVDWTQIGNVLDRSSQLDLSITTGWASLGVYAPTLRYHDGVFHLITTNLTHRGALTFVVTTDEPSGRWSDPVFVDVSGVDPDLCWDRAGNCWMHYSRSGDIARCRIDVATGTILDGPKRTWSGTGLQYPEAPHLFERRGIWYLVIAEGGTHAGHAVSVARGPSPEGPWEPCPANPILSHRSTDRPIQNTGHADLVEAPNGSWWMVLLGVRPKGGFHVLGRETFLTPVTWIDDWPVVDVVEPTMAPRPPGPLENRVDAATSGMRDEFDDPVLHPRWIAIRRAPSAFASLTARPGQLTLDAGDATLDDDEPSFVGMRQQHRRVCARTLVDAGTSAEAGLAVLMADDFHAEVAVVGDELVAKVRASSLRMVMSTVPSRRQQVVLRIETRDAPLGPDVVALGWEDADGVFHVIGEVDGRFLSTEVALGFTGRVIGMYAVGGGAAFDWFEYGELEAT
jgi:beta-xylosidase